MHSAPNLGGWENTMIFTFNLLHCTFFSLGDDIDFHSHNYCFVSFASVLVRNRISPRCDLLLIFWVNCGCILPLNQIIAFTTQQTSRNEWKTETESRHCAKPCPITTLPSHDCKRGSIQEHFEADLMYSFMKGAFLFQLLMWLESVLWNGSWYLTCGKLFLKIQSNFNKISWLQQWETYVSLYN